MDRCDAPQYEKKLQRSASETSGETFVTSTMLHSGSMQPVKRGSNQSARSAHGAPITPSYPLLLILIFVYITLSNSHLRVPYRPELDDLKRQYNTPVNNVSFG